MKKVLILLFISTTLFASGPNPKGSLKGSLLDEETKLPLIGANIYLKDTNWGTTTDLDGNYSIDNLPVGTYTVAYSYLGYETVTKTDIIIRSDRTTFVNVELKSSFVEMDNIVVEAGYFTEIENKPVSTVNFSAEEIRRSPGTAEDVSRILFSLPSISKVNDQRNSLIVRGGSPVENSFYLDNIEIPNINHFPVMGSSDGPIGLINVDFIEDVNFYSGGFSPIYGDKLSSVMELSFREGDKDNFEPQLKMSMAGFGATIEGPVSDKGSYMISANRSYLDLIFGAINEGAPIPQYGDVQGKVVYHINDNNKITLLNILSLDDIDMDYEGAIDADANIYGTTTGLTNVGGINWQNVWGDNGYSNTSISYTLTKYDSKYNETKAQRHIYTNKTNESQVKLRNVNYYKAGKSHSFEFGVEGAYLLNQFDMYYAEYQDNYGNLTPALTIDTDLNTLKASLFGIHHWQLTDNFKIDYGVRGDYFDYNQRFHLSPRVSLSYAINDKTTLTGSAGIFYQNIGSNFLVQNDAFKGLNTPKSNHYVLGISRMLGEDTRLTVEAYYKDYSNFPIDPAQPNMFLFDQAMITGIFLNHENLVDKGEAFSRGIEVILQKKLASEFYGLISASYSKTRYKDLEGNWHDRIYDNEVNFAVEGGYIPNDEWEFKLRWVYAGGAPYTPFDAAASAANRRGIWDLNRINGERLPNYHSLNIRVDKRFYFSGSSLILYLSIWNAYGRDNVAQYVWNEYKNEQQEMNMWNTMPVLGVEFKF